MGSPVCGLRPTRALRCAFTRRPMPGTTNTPFFLVSLMAVSARCSRNAAAVLLFSSVFSARWRTSWVLVKPAAMNPPLLKGWVLCWDAELILIPAPVEKQQNRRILRGFSHSGTENGHKNSGFTRCGEIFKPSSVAENPRAAVLVVSTSADECEFGFAPELVQKAWPFLTA